MHWAATGVQWRELCRQAEGSGCTTVQVADHFTDQFALIPALSAALEASTTLRAGALVARKRFATPTGLTPAETLRAPYVWTGETRELCEKLERHRERWGVSSWAIDVNAIPRLAGVIEQLAGT
jgi:hypothetical protein